MRHISPPTDAEAPRAFLKWRARHPNANYSRFRENRIKQMLKEALIKRQQYLCCYCESRIGMDVSHIEHIDPQLGGQSNRTMDFSNMAASCIKEPLKGDIRALKGEREFFDSILHCGHARGAHRVVSPYDEKCEHLFFYSFSGQIKVAQNLNEADALLARESIDFLRLNAPSLVGLRRLAMFETIKLLKNGASKKKIFDSFNGRLLPFISAAHAAYNFYMSAKE